MLCKPTLCTRNLGLQALPCRSLCTVPHILAPPVPPPLSFTPLIFSPAQAPKSGKEALFGGREKAIQEAALRDLEAAPRPHSPPPPPLSPFAARIGRGVKGGRGVERGEAGERGRRKGIPLGRALLALAKGDGGGRRRGGG